jgi:hypothetical protein
MKNTRLSEKRKSQTEKCATPDNRGEIRRWVNQIGKKEDKLTSRITSKKSNELISFRARYWEHRRLIDKAFDDRDAATAFREAIPCRRMEKCVRVRLETIIRRPILPSELEIFLRGAYAGN